jgi:hypothetical protein
VQPKNCLQCGSSEHNSHTCPQGSRDYMQRLQVAEAYRRAGQEAKLISAVKYTQPAQRSLVYQSRPVQRARAQLARSGLMLARAPPVTLAHWMVSDGLFFDLQGKACEDPRCQEDDSVLGRMVGVRVVDFMAEQLVTDITRDTVCYRCRRCRKRYTVTHKHPLFPALGHGGHSCSYQVLAWWAWCEDKTVTMVARELNVNETVVAGWFAVAAVVTAEDALVRQDAIVFGRRGTLTTDVEADETCFQSWSVQGQG